MENAWFGIIAILPTYRGKGYVKTAIGLLEKTYPTITKWTLCTISQEASLVGLYSSLGFEKTGEIETIQPGMDLVYMQKEIVKS